MTISYHIYHIYINNLFNQTEESYLIDSMEISNDTNLNELIQKRDNLLIADALNMIQLNETVTKPTKQINKTNELPKLKVVTKQQKNEQIAIEKKRILLSLIESSREKKLDRLLDSNFYYEPLKNL